MTTTQVRTEEIAAQWVEALRSGTYKQGQRYLHVGDSFCCLGVLCNLYSQEWDESGDRVDDDGRSAEDGRIVYSHIGDASGLPGDEVLMWAELDGEVAEQLATLNDTGKTFEELADEIELIYGTGGNVYSEPS